MTHTTTIAPTEPQTKVATLGDTNRQQIDELLAAWLQTLTKETQRSYGADLRHFAGWLGARDVAEGMQTLFVQTSTGANALVLRYRQFLLTAPVFSSPTQFATGIPDRQGYSSSVINSRLSALRSVSKIARLTGLFTGTIEIRGVPGATVRDSSGVGPEAFHKMMRKLDAMELTKGLKPKRRFELVRDRAILRLLHDQALRRIEVVRASVSDLQLDIDEPAMLVHSKGPRGSTDRILLSHRVVGVLREWLAVRGMDPGPLFHRKRVPTPGVMPEPLDPSSINRICALRGRQAKIRKKCRPHGLRHTAITTGLDRTNGDLRSVASMARHRNPSTTLKYDDNRRRKARDLSQLIGEEDS